MKKWAILFMAFMSILGSGVQDSSSETTQRPCSVGVLARPRGIEWTFQQAVALEMWTAMEARLNSGVGSTRPRLQIFGGFQRTNDALGHSGTELTQYRQALMYSLPEGDQLLGPCFKRLRSEGASAVVLLIPYTPALEQVLEKEKIPTLGVFASDVPANSTWFSNLSYSYEVYVEKTLEYLGRSGIKDLAVIMPSGIGRSAGLLKGIKAMAPKHGIQNITEIQVDITDRQPGAKLKSIPSSGAQAVISLVNIPSVTAALFKERKVLGDLPFVQAFPYIDLSSGDAEGIIGPVGKFKVADQVQLTEPEKSMVSDVRDLETKISPTGTITFVFDRNLRLAAMLSYPQGSDKTDMDLPKKMTEKKIAWSMISTLFKTNNIKGIDLSYVCAVAYDAHALILDAVKAVGSDRTKIRDYLENKQQFVGASGTYTFQPKDRQWVLPGVSLQVKDRQWILQSDSLVMAVVKNGKWVVLDK